MTEIIQARLVGDHFRPPAKSILQVLGLSTPLRLEAEPDNAYDSDAIKVFVKSKDIPEKMYETLNSLASGYGFTIEEILAQDEWWLGYIANSEKTGGKFASGLERTELDLSKLECKLGFSPDGKYTVMVKLEEKSE
jgi:hypothetical protein